MIRRLVFLLAAAALVAPVAASGFAPTDPLSAKQWYLTQIHAFDFWPDVPPTLAPVRVAVVDSGLDLGHPEFAGRVALARSFVGGDAVDRQGHGTFVAGIIAANAGNNEGITGIALSAQLLIAKVVRPDGTISPVAEAKAIRWAADHGARVINLSLGGLRSRNKNEDTYSAVEQDAIEYAYAKGAVLVAAVGNGDQAPKTPWDLASYPAALPHVIGVSSLAQDGSVPAFSNRDAFFNDVAAPGVGIVSTLPRSLTAARPSCVDQGYSICGPAEFRSAEGTSYSAAEVSGAAALLIAMKPTLTPDQVAALLERSAADANPSSGCRRCIGSRDPYTRLGPGRRGRGAAGAGVASAGRGPLRVERRRGCARVRALGPVDRRDRHARLLGRPDRRLQDQAPRRPDGRRFAPGTGGHETEPRALAAGDPAGRGAFAGAAGAAADAVGTRWRDGALPAPRAAGRLVLRRAQAAAARRRAVPVAHLQIARVRVGVQLPEVEYVARWPEYAAMARAAEESGFDSIWLGDHLLYRGDGREERGPWEVWTMLAALAAVTERVELGPLVACASFHPPGLIAKMAATVAEVSGGRFVLGLGAGWNETEYSAFGLPYDHRVSRFEESFEIVRRTLAGERVTLHGRFWQADDLVVLPLPEQPIPLLIGSNGPRMLRATLPYVDRWNTWYDRYGNTIEGFAELNAFVSEQAEAVGRDPVSLYRSTAVLVELDPDAAKRPHSDIRKQSDPVTPDGLGTHLAALEEVGADEAILILRPIDEASIRAVGALLPARP